MLGPDAVKLIMEATGAVVGRIQMQIAEEMEARQPIANEILFERARQIAIEGKNDAVNTDGQLARAAGGYALFAGGAKNLEKRKERGWPGKIISVPRHWPWEVKFFKPHSPRRALVIAAALIIAEIERLDTLEKEKTQ